MRLRIADRVLVALAGLLLIACCAGIVAQMFFGVDLVGLAARVFSSDSLKMRAALIALSVFLLLLGLYCLFVLFRHRRRKDKFILQRNDSGELAISLKALENMVWKCLDQHPEIQVQHLYMENQKDGLLIRLRGGVAGGVSIPLTVEAIQRQIKQYVTACSGVEVKGIRVQIESTDQEVKDAPFAIEGPEQKPLLKEENEGRPETAVPAARPETVETPSPAAEPVSAVQEQKAEAAAEPAAQPQPAAPVQAPEETDDRPLHQRLFKAKPEPCIMPEPPEEIPVEAANPAEASEAESVPADTEAENVNEMASAEATDGDAAFETAEPAEKKAGSEEPAAAETATEDLAEEKAGTEDLAAAEAATEDEDNGDAEAFQPEYAAKADRMEAGEAAEALSPEEERKPEDARALFSDFDSFVTGNRDQEERSHEV